MNKKDNLWKRSISTLEKIAKDLYYDKNRKKYDEIISTLEDLGIENLTLGDIRTFIKKQSGLKVNFNDNYVFSYIMNLDNREELIRFCESKNPIDTIDNDYNYNLNAMKSRRI